MEKVKKIVVIGPESTGKSVLCQKLAAHFNTLWVPEYAREYLEKNGPAYTYDDLLTIAKGQIEREEAMGNRQWSMSNGQPAMGNEQSAMGNEQLAMRNEQLAISNEQSTFNQSSPLFIDTDMHVMKVWAEFVFNKSHNWILNRIAERKYDLYLLCNIDLPWVEDLLREHPDQKTRQKLFLHYLDMMIHQSVPWQIISGNYEERFSKAVAAVNDLI
jgi:nicotinamide riboside kinase